MNDGVTPPGGTILTPAALFQLRGELEEHRKKQREIERRLEALEAEVNGQKARFDEVDERIGGIDTRLVVTETIQDRLMTAITKGNLIAERTEKHMLVMMVHLKIPVPEAA